MNTRNMLKRPGLAHTSYSPDRSHMYSRQLYEESLMFVIIKTT